MSIYELFQSILGQASEDQTLRELPVDSECGRDCAKAIFAARALLDHVEASGAPRLPDVIEAVDHIVQIYWRG